MITLGLEALLQQKGRISGKRLGLLCNQASTDHLFVHSRDLIMQGFPGQLTCIFSPQHGFFAEKQDNMIESDHLTDTSTGLPVYSLYGTARKPTEKMFAEIDLLLIDIVDVGTRVYTFLYTMAYCLEAAARWGKEVVVLDRPNPIGGVAVEGNILKPDCVSFVGLYPLPMRHGLTFGELALLINEEFGIGADLQVIKMEGWQRSMQFADTGLPWVFPSPNMPTPVTAAVYPGQVIWEGTNISEGRGTTLPFELVGAPFLQPEKLIDRMQDTELPGCCFRPLVFEPTSGKWAGSACNGFQIHVTSADFRPYRTTLALLQAIMELYPDDFAYKQPPYEYEFERLPMDLILGDMDVRQKLEAGMAVMEIEKGWQDGLEEFDHMRQKYFLYN